MEEMAEEGVITLSGRDGITSGDGVVLLEGERLVRATETLRDLGHTMVTFYLIHVISDRKPRLVDVPIR